LDRILTSPRTQPQSKAQPGVALLLSIVVAFCAVGCGGDSADTRTDSSGDQSHGLATTSTTATTATPETSTNPSERQSRLSYEVDELPVSANDFDYTLSASLTLGAGSTNTEGQRPPFVNVVAPVTGAATLTNVTSGYTASANDIPLIGVWALYPSDSAICRYTGGINGGAGGEFHPGPDDLCGADIAEFAAACDSTFDSLGEGERAELVAWVQSAGSYLDPASPEPCEHISSFEPPDTFAQLRLTPARAERIVEELSQPPEYWALVDETGALGDAPVDDRTDCRHDEFYIQGGDYVGRVIASEPTGVEGCLGS
jgi:hypothetical protein